MSKSPHRLRGDAAECWRAMLFGEIIRILDRPVTVRSDETIRLPRSGRWETGLARVRPAFDDSLGATAFAVAWRWACAERGANAWPGMPLIAAKATDQPVSVGNLAPLAHISGGTEVHAAAGDREWHLLLPGALSIISVRGPRRDDWRDVDAIADIVAAWLGVPWTVRHQTPGDRPVGAVLADAPVDR